MDPDFFFIKKKEKKILASNIKEKTCHVGRSRPRKVGKDKQGRGFSINDLQVG